MTDDTTKTFYAGDNVKVIFKINAATRHLDVQPPSGDHIDVDGKHYVEVKYHEGRAVFTRRPIPVPPTYEAVHNAMLHAETFEDEVTAVMRLFGVKDAKPTTKKPADDEDAGDSIADLEESVS